MDAQQLNGALSYHGEVDTVDPSHGVLWILHGALRERKLLDASEHQIRRCPSAAPALCPPAAHDPGASS